MKKSYKEKMPKSKSGGAVSDERIDEVLNQYIESALWSSNDNADESGGEPLDANYSITDIAPEAKEKMRADVKKFLEDNEELLKESGLDDSQIGHDFWLTRHRHGAGFWDRGLGEVGKKLTIASHQFKESFLEVGDDKKIHVMAEGGKMAIGGLILAFALGAIGGAVGGYSYRAEISSAKENAQKEAIRRKEEAIKALERRTKRIKDFKEGVKRGAIRQIEKLRTGGTTGKFDSDIQDFIDKEAKLSTPFKYRAKILWGQEIVLKETMDGMPKEKLVIGDWELAKKVANVLNKNAQKPKSLTEKESAKALKEGWIISNSESGDDEIQKDDEAGVFKSDSQARAFVKKEAGKGSDLHLKAMEIVGVKMKEGGAVENMDVDEILKHFLVAGLWASYDDNEESLDANYSISDVDEHSKEEIKKGIVKFLQENSEIINRIGLSEESIGHDLFLDSQGHGAGFWDRNYIPKPDGKILSKSAEKIFPSDSPYVQDGKVYFNTRSIAKEGGIVINTMIKKLSDEGLLSILKSHEHIKLFGDESRKEAEEILQLNLDSDKIDEVEVLTVLGGELPEEEMKSGGGAGSKSVKTILEEYRKEDEIGHNEFLTLRDIFKEFEGKKITARASSKLPEGYKWNDRPSLGWIEIVSPTGKNHNFIRYSQKDDFKIADFEEFDGPYNRGSKERIEKINDILNDPKKLNRAEQLFEDVREKYQALKKLAKETYDGEFDSYNNPAFYSILRNMKVSSRVLSDLNFDKDEMKAGGKAGYKDFKEGVDVQTTVKMTVEDVGDDIPVGTTGVVFAGPNDAEQLVGVIVNGSHQYLPQDVLRAMKYKEGDRFKMADDIVYIGKPLQSGYKDYTFYYVKDDSILKAMDENSVDKFVKDGKLVPIKSSAGYMKTGGTAEAKKDMSEAKKLTEQFLDKYGDVFNLTEHRDEILKKVEPQDYLGHGAGVFIGFTVSSNIGDKLEIGQVKPERGYISLSSDINKAGVGDGKKPDVARTAVINLEIKGKKRYSQRTYEEGRYAKSYDYARSVEEVMEKFSDYFSNTFQHLIKKDDLKFGYISPVRKAGGTVDAEEAKHQLRYAKASAETAKAYVDSNSPEDKKKARQEITESQNFIHSAMDALSPAPMKGGGKTGEVKYRLNRLLTDNEANYLIQHGLDAKESGYTDGNNDNNVLTLTPFTSLKDKSKSNVQAIFEDALGTKKEYQGTVTEVLEEGGLIGRKINFSAWGRDESKTGFFENKNVKQPTTGTVVDKAKQKNSTVYIIEEDNTGDLFTLELGNFAEAMSIGDNAISTTEVAERHVPEASTEGTEQSTSDQPEGGTEENRKSGGKLPKSKQVEKIGKHITSLERSLDSDVIKQNPDLKEKIENRVKDLKKVHTELSTKVSAKEKMDLESGKFYIEIPTARKNDLYLKLRDKGIKVKWKSMGDTTRAVAPNKNKQSKVYDLYSKILQRENATVPSLESISGKLSR